MKIKLLAAAVMGLMVSATWADDMLASEKGKLSYSIGADLGKNFKTQGIEIEPATMVQGFQDAYNGSKIRMTDEQMKTTMANFQKDLMSKRQADFSKKADANKAKGDTFLAENKSKEGIVALPSGLQYKVLTQGNGAKPGKEDTVTVEYTGHLIDGQVFDSTEKSGKPATFKVSQVIPGWTEILQLMPSGSTWEVFIPASLAYGPRGVGGPIGPNETLIFKIHLLSVKKGEA